MGVDGASIRVNHERTEQVIQGSIVGLVMRTREAKMSMDARDDGLRAQLNVIKVQNELKVDQDVPRH